ncbi:hypothetical protein C9374_010895 [Naegleria lovaniensis]|uniref:LisH domain-containing protein n=1 Tax=Naegleria lovaniensis TaxID=51637 RepID=A0AA88GAL7_NAELO|nr:uncharacterized protein C9374_010895 [Naegleria lovaniensis]KAG2374325.1 hypothetical protein C9374_010895 [Naegleria lovaniensis]
MSSTAAVPPPPTSHARYTPSSSAPSSNQADHHDEHHQSEDPNTQLVSRSDVAFIVLQYLREENFTESYEAFKRESKEILADFDTNSQLKGLSKILTEYIQLSNLQQQNAYKQALVQSICKDVKKQQTVSHLLEAMTSLLESVSNEQFNVYHEYPSQQTTSHHHHYYTCLPNQSDDITSTTTTTTTQFTQVSSANNNNTTTSSSSGMTLSCTTPSISPSAASTSTVIPTHAISGALSPHSHSSHSSSTNHSVASGVSAASVASQVTVTSQKQSKQKKTSSTTTNGTKTKKQSKTSKAVEKKKASSSTTCHPPTFPPPLYPPPPINACFPFPMYPPTVVPFSTTVPITLPDPIETPPSTTSSTPASTNYSSSDQKENNGNMEITPSSSSPKTPRHKGQSTASPTTMQKIFGSIPNSTSTAEPNFSADDFFNSPSFFFQSPLHAKNLTTGKRKRERFEIEDNTGLCVTLFEDNTKADKDHSDVDAFLSTLKYD